MQKGSRIAFIAPAGPPDPERLKRGERFFEKAGYKVKIYPQARRKLGYLAGDDRSRAEALVDAFADDTIDAVMCVRGGYGALRLLPFIDFEIIKKNPKIFIGYSDITILLLSIFKKCDLVTFHGPMAAIEFGMAAKPYTNHSFFNMLSGNFYKAEIDIPPTYKIKVINGGIAKGRLAGGNLCLMTKLIGTGLLPSFKNRLVFFEDTEEEPYRIDGYLSQLFQTTDFGMAAGYIIGEFTRTKPKFGGMAGWNVKQVIKDYFAEINKPVIYGFPCGHGKEKVTIPIGVKAVLDADGKTLIFKEPGVKR
ncbi:MAG: LD-carboxypeptidase [Candidatus Zixiibacteriota bacterium]|nr:MAG: LD-carboxypeptidase [candidate division Zixibacteria bacterium]